MDNNLKKELLGWIIPFMIAIAAALLIKSFIFDFTQIENVSMQPTLYANDRVFLDIASYKLGKPNRYDIVVFDSPVEEGKLYVKRVIGNPGDNVSIKDGNVFLNGTQLKENYLPQGTKTTGNIDISIPNGTVFVMGDNREHSEDSRAFGPIKIESIKGRALFRVYPFDSIKGL